MLNRLLMGYIALATVWTAGVLLSRLGAFPYYFRNPAIFLAYFCAVCTNVALLAALPQRETLTPRQSAGFWALLCAAALLPWFELWFGSTFYYGEDRSLQGLPFAVVNLGPVSTVVLLTAATWELARPKLEPRLAAGLTAGVFLNLTGLLWRLLVALEEPWRLG
ncbi:MAG: hypothetical protein HY554_16630 [Elusimicrobia bacterium]|nr:hypothetical protein [Elusimicrobiota bacterium]